MKYSQFEDLPVWIDARLLTKEIYEITNNGDFKKDYRLKAQIRDCSVSVMSNIAEGFENQSNKQFIRYLYIAKGSCGELRSQLYVAFDVGYIREDELSHLKRKSASISKQCSKLISYLRGYEKGDTVKDEEVPWDEIIKY